METPRPTEDEAKTPKELVDEIQQIIAQYKSEIRCGSGRVAWPESVRTRVISLARLEVPKKQIADLTDIPLATVFLWTRSIPSRGRGRPPLHPASELEPGFRELPRASGSQYKTTVVGMNALTEKMAIDSPIGLVIERKRPVAFGLPDSAPRSRRRPSCARSANEPRISVRWA
jgi:hypothetical protein